MRAEIARRVAGRAGESGRHARVDPAGDRATGGEGATTPAADEEPGAEHPATPPASSPDAPSGSAASAGPAVSEPGAAPASADEHPAPAERPAPAEPDDTGDEAVARRRPRPGGPRPRSTPHPDPDAPHGVRDSTGSGPTDSGKQWPPVTGASGLPRRVPGATTSAWTRDWSPDPEALHTGAGATPGQPPPGAVEHPETRPVPTHWTAAGRRSVSAPPEPPAEDDTVVSIPGPAAVAGAATAPETHDHGDHYDDGDHYDGDHYDDVDLTEAAAERTEILWRAPGLDVPVTAAPTPEPAGDAPADLISTAPAPYTGARPRRFAADPTAGPTADLTAEPTAAPVAAEAEGSERVEEALGTGRVRIVLSERRSTAHSSRRLSDVQDPGTVGTLLRSSLVRNQLLLSLRVSLVALFGLGMLPALFMAVPLLGTIEVVGIRLPWLLLGVLVYPFLLGLGWWYVRSSETAEQEFADSVADR